MPDTRPQAPRLRAVIGGGAHQTALMLNGQAIAVTRLRVSLSKPNHYSDFKQPMMHVELDMDADDNRKPFEHDPMFIFGRLGTIGEKDLAALQAMTGQVLTGKPAPILTLALGPGIIPCAVTVDEQIIPFLTDFDLYLDATDNAASLLLTGYAQDSQIDEDSELLTATCVLLPVEPEEMAALVPKALYAPWVTLAPASESVAGC